MRFIDKFLEKNKSRVLGLDILRSIAILLVVYGHGVYVLPKSFKTYYLYPVPYIDGVSVFFVLSGFLIGGILLKIIQNSGFTRKDLLNFWIRRWFRTLPNYFFVLAILVIYQFIVFKNLGAFNIKYLFFFQNFNWAHPDFFPEAWSLCVEEWFYLLFPLACYLFYKIIKDKSKSVLFSALIFITVPFVLRLIMYKSGIGIEDWNTNFQKVVVLRLDSLMYGIIAAYLYKFKMKQWIQYKNICLVISLIIVAALTLYSKTSSYKHNMAFLAVYQYNFESLATFFALPFFTQVKSTKFKMVAFTFTFISIISYSMYLLNLTPVQGIMIPETMSLMGLKNNSGFYVQLFQYFIFWLYVILGSYLLYRFFEKPMMDLRDKIKF